VAVVATRVSQIAAPAAADRRAHSAAPAADALAEAGGARSDTADFADFTDALADAGDARSDFAELILPSSRTHSAAPADALAEAGGARLDTADLMNLILPNLRCPITSLLLVCPVRAEDGHVYEADALERWLRSSRRSPLTNKPMGAETTKSGRTRSLILAAIENGVVDDEAAATWYLESAKAIAAGKLPGSKMSAAVAYMDRAIFLSATTEVALARRAVAIKAEMVALDDQRQALLREASRCGTDAVSVVFGGDDYAPMMSFLTLRNGHSKIRVIYDPDEFRRLCERPAPGAFSEVGWDDDMVAHCGEEFIVRHQSERLKSYRIEDADGDELSVPFDACILTRL
jgi:hypothetical protein